MSKINHPIIYEDMENIYNRNINWLKLKEKTVLITGAYGMLASYIVFFLVWLNEVHKMSIHIIAVGRNEEKAQKCFSDFWKKPYFDFRTDNIAEPIRNMPQVDYIIHAASLASPHFYSVCPIEVAEPNAVGTYQLLKFAVETRCKGFLLFSSGDIYGRTENISEITETTVGKLDPLAVHSCYSESKRMAETWCQSYYREKGVPVKIARIGHTYGPTMDIQNDPRVFAAFMKAAVEGKDIIMYSDGKAKRPFCYIADAVAAFMLLLLHGESGEAYNVCNTEQFMSIKEVAEIVANLQPELNLKIVIKKREKSDGYVENNDNRENKPIEKKLKAIGWGCHYNAKEGFGRTLKFLKTNVDGGKDEFNKKCIS